LSGQLAAAQQDRANKLEYDALASQIQQLPSRAASVETTARLEQEIQDLGQESDAFKRVWQRRQAAFDQICVALEETFSSLRDEKAEMERKGALDEDQDETAPGSPKSAHEEDPIKETPSKLNPAAVTFKPAAAKPPDLDEAAPEREDVVMGEAELEEGEFE
jgi:TolA-binding protein